MIILEGAAAAAVIKRMRRFRKRCDTFCAEAADDFTISVQTNEISGTVSGRRGDYICKNPAGGLYPVPKETFESMYEEVKGERC